MKVGSLCSGIGGLDLGVERAGFGPVRWQVEIDPYARSVLARHWPRVKRYEDVREVGAKNLVSVDLLIAGFPCQDISSAGKGAGLEGPKSGLWREVARIAEELRPSCAIIENVASRTRCWLPIVRRDLHLLGYRTRALALSAAEVGAPHLRKRIFVIAADPERLELRDEQEWRGWPRNESSQVAAQGAQAHASALGDALLDGRPWPEGQGDEGWTEPPAGSWWASEPAVGRVVDGLSGGMDGWRRRSQLRCLGNAVVPDDAMVAASFLRQYTRPRVNLRTVRGRR